MVAFYALCLVAPVTAFAFSNGSMPAHCLTDDHHDMGVAHDHQADADHQKPGDDDQGYPGKCCGLFGVSAIAPSFDVVAMPMAQVSHVVMPAAESLFGRSTSRIDRPPRVLQSL